MTKEKLQQGQALLEKIQNIEAEIQLMLQMVESSKGSPQVVARVQGMTFELPRAAFRGEMSKRKQELESQLLPLQAEFDAL